MHFVKALLPGSLLTWVVASIIGSNHSKGGFLFIHLAEIQGQSFYWSWPLFFAATGLAWSLFWMTD